MTITYEYEDALYVNLTNKCNCNCEFCLRHGRKEGSIYTEDSLWLEREPTRKEALDSFLSRDVCSYREIVFCGYGEPTYRLDDILWLVDQLKERFGRRLPPVRINTNGHANLILGRDVVPELKGRIAMGDPTASSSAWAELTNMLLVMGEGDTPAECYQSDAAWDYIDKFIDNLDGIVLSSSSQVYKGVIDGEYAVGLTFEQGAATYVSQGNIKVVYMEEGVIIRGDGVYIVKDCPNLDSARKFVDWLTSYDAQTYMNETQFRRTIRTDVPETDAMQSMSTINVITDDETIASENKTAWIEQFQEALVDAAD